MTKRFFLLIGILAIAVAAFAQTGDVTGTVWLPGNQGGAANAYVVLHRHMHPGDSVTTTADGDGHFAFTGIMATNWDARAILEGYGDAFEPIWVIPNQSINIMLFLGPPMNQTGSVTGTVFLPDPTQGPAAGAMVVLRDNMHWEDSLTATTDGDGHYSFTDIPAHGYAAVARLEGYLDGFAFAGVIPNQTVTVNIVLGPAVGETGSVAGMVLTGDNQPAANAQVMLDQDNPWHPGFHGFALTDASGAFSFDVVPPGNYNISASLMNEGFASEQIQVTSGQTTNVTLTLEHNDHGGGGHHGGDHHGEHHGDSLTVVDLTGVAIVLAPDSNHMHARYFIDVNGDGAADYHLSFGPFWYDPNGDSLPNRPADGDDITIHGGLLTYGTPPMVVVYDINGLQWRPPFQGHGGHGGGEHQHDGCNPDSLVAVELEGNAIVQQDSGWHGDMTRYAINVNDDPAPDFVLDFGPPSYDPGNGATRPADGDQITIVGGQIYCPNAPFQVVIVYEINGMFWREPGDTSGFGAESMSAGDPVGVPVNYLTASNFPNPFNPTTTITFALPMNGNVTLKVFDITGREVATLVNGYQAAGSYKVNWDATNLSSGIYFYRVSLGNRSFTNRMVLMK